MPSSSEDNQRPPQNEPLTCHRCGYDLSSYNDGLCPECGATTTYRGETFLAELMQRARGSGKRRCNICGQIADFPASGACPNCGGKASNPIEDDEHDEST